MVSKEVLSRRTDDYRNWAEAYARNHELPMEWAEKGLRKEDHVLPALRRMEKPGAYGVYFIFKSMEQGRTFRISVPKYPTQDPNHRILAHQRSRLTHYYFYIRDEVLGPKFPKKERGQMNLSRFYAIAQIEYCRNFIFKRRFPIHKIFERSCEIGLWRLTANRISEIFGLRLHKRLRGKLATVIDQIEHGHHVFRACWKSAFLKQYEKFSRCLRNELCSNNQRDFGLKKGLDHLDAVRKRFQTITDRFAGFQAECLNVHADFPLLQRLALPIRIGSVRYPGIKIQDARIIRRLEVFLHGGTTVGDWTAKQIHQSVLTTFQLASPTQRTAPTANSTPHITRPTRRSRTSSTCWLPRDVTSSNVEGFLFTFFG